MNGVNSFYDFHHKIPPFTSSGKQKDGRYYQNRLIKAVRPSHFQKNGTFSVHFASNQ